MNMLPSRIPMATSVCRALTDSGGLKAGTPLEMASVPVIAVHPWANARMSTNTPSASPIGCRTGGGGSYVMPPPRNRRYSPKPISTYIMATKR